MHIATLLTGFIASLAAAVPLRLATEDVMSVSKLGARDVAPFWLGNIKRSGTVAFGNASYPIYRNVKSYGAVGDGKKDDTAAINAAISDGHRCGLGCDSSTITPALVYFPPGTYLVSTPVIQYYYTQLVGDAVNIPVLKAAGNFKGIAVIDSDPYGDGGINWYTNQNNFFRQVRNFVIDLTGLSETVGAGIHWQVAQATSLQNIVFNMQPKSPNNKQSGIFMDNGSGGFFSDLTFNGGNYGAFLGNQQFTTRNLTFNGQNTAIYMNWNWLWAFKSVTISNANIGIDMSTSPANQTVGSVMLQDVTITGTPIGIKSAFTSNSAPTTGGTLILDNVDCSGCSATIADSDNRTILGGQKVASWVSGNSYTGSAASRVSQIMPAPSVPAELLGSGGKIAERSKPQYENLPASSFVSVKSKGAKGDGSTDDTAAIQNAMNSLPSGSILYFDHGAYIISNTVKVPKNIKIVGEVWPLIMARGSVFQDQSKPTPVFQIGQAGDVGNVEIQDLIFETVGPQPGAVMMEWNVAGTSPGQAAMWDTHFRIGGTAGTQLQSDKCSKNPDVTAAANPACEGAYLLFHATPSSSPYLENVWAWVADHELDRLDHNQINIFNGRGMLIESTKGSWFYGTSAEHSTLYNYNLWNAKNVYMSAIQSETAYFQPNPDARSPFTPDRSRGDPTFTVCQGSNSASCYSTWGLMVQFSSDVLIYGTGLYSFFDNYGQDCLATESCQENMIHVIGSSDVTLFGASTKAAVNMILQDSRPQALAKDNMNNFCQTVGRWVGS